MKPCHFCVGRWYGSDYCSCEIPEHKRPPGGFKDDRSYQYDADIGRYIEVEPNSELYENKDQ